jgi:hypothetical protein
MILNRRRFLSKYGLDDLNHLHQMQNNSPGFGGGNGGGVNPLKVQAVGLLHAVGYLKVRRHGVSIRICTIGRISLNCFLFTLRYAGSSDRCQYHYHFF